ncbi:MAG: alpha-L-rhamnosidase N-terminal domain-containing protein, partial [Planctomycetes bacterium]|nr:alpha-L-rhamnosidase N-terminal domain-containing protein [Planctomycetota bacterium]
MRYYRILALGCLVFLPAASPLNARGLTPASLRAEYRVNPLGLEVRNPRLSWTVESDERGEKQTAYRVLAAGSPEALQGDRGDLWDSGKVGSDETARIVYAGKPLRSGTRCWWKVMVWSVDGKPSNWSEPALWSMGLLDPSDWKARWIGHDRPLELAKHAAGSEAITKAQWIWFPEGNPAASAPIGARYFRRAVEIPRERPFRKATLDVAADNEATIFINGAKVGQANSFSSARSFEVTGHLRGGSNLIAAVVKNAGDSPNPAGLLAALQVELEAGEPLIVATDSSWLSTDQERKGWESPAQEATGWVAAKAVGSNGIPPWGRVAVQALRLPPPRYLRRGFKLTKPIRRATLYASALGLYEIRLNGQRAGNDYFTPGWTDYDQRVYYQTYDVTPLVKNGDNAIGGVIADGWYAGYVG